ncbi:MAG: DUF4835 family protein [Cyclonatronaceae bacterium]
MKKMHPIHSVSLFFISLVMLAGAPRVSAQELNVTVDVNKSQISSSAYDYLDELAPVISRYLNDYKWTDDTYQEEERINVNVQIVLTNVDNNANFDANLIITSYRPIYNSRAQTPLMIISDNAWRFNYTRNRNIVRDQMQFDDIASVLDFYAYMILGYDYDSFSEMGGTPQFRNAQQIVEIAQNAASTGWASSGSRRNRYQLITQMMAPSYEGFRKAFYQYHRLGLDQFLNNQDEARAQILEALTVMRATQRQNTENYLFDLMFSTKYREMTAIFLDAETSQKLDAYNLLVELDQSHMTEYEKLQ